MSKNNLNKIQTTTSKNLPHSFRLISVYKQRRDFKQKLEPLLKSGLRLKRDSIYAIAGMIAGAGAGAPAAAPTAAQAALTLTAVDPCAAVSNLEVAR